METVLGFGRITMGYSERCSDNLFFPFAGARPIEEVFGWSPAMALGSR